MISFSFMVCLNCKYIETTFVSDYFILFDQRGNKEELHLDQTSNKRLENRPLSWQRVFKSVDSLISSIHKLISGVTTLLRSAGNCLPERRRDESVLPDLFLTS